MFSIQDIQVEHQSVLGKPLVTDVLSPMISFSLQSDRPGCSLRSAFISIGAWSTTVTEPSGIVYQGPKLKPFTNYPIQIKAVSDLGETAEAAASFNTGRLSIPWRAQWISDPDHHVESPSSPTPMYFRRRFHTREGLERLTICATAMGIFDFYLDGKRLHEDYFAPGFTNYSSDLQYICFELSNLQPGMHECMVIVTGGWAVGRTTHISNTNKSRSCLSADRQALLAEFRLFYANGEHMVFGTDPRFEVSEDGPLRFADFYDGEIYDATIHANDMIWHSATAERLKVHPRIRARYGLPVTAHEIFSPEHWMHSPSGKLLCDFGQNMAGIVSFTVQGHVGQEIMIRHGEALEKGELFTKNLRTAKQEIRYRCRDGSQQYSPRFTYMGFRYIELQGVPKEDISIQAIALYSDMDVIGSFRCSDEDLNQLQSNLVWSMKSNFVDIPTDCPQRDERQGWTGDIALFAPTACFNFDTSRFLSKWLQDLKTEQKPSGAIPFVIPARKGITPAITTSCWGDSCILVPWALYQTNGDVKQLADQYPVMKKYMASVRRWAAFSLPVHGSSYILRFPFQFGDWCAPYGSVRDWLAKGPWIGTAYYFYACQLMSRIAGILGYEQDALTYRKLSAKIRKAFCRVFTDGNGRLKNEFQSAYVLALAFGLVDGDTAGVMADRLWQLIQDAGRHLNTGFTATPFLLFALCDHGYAREAYQLLQQDSDPSWLYPIRHGATTIWEQWGAVHEDGSVQESSLNHYAYGAVGDFLYRRICGLEPLEAGYRRFLVKPVPAGGLTWAECTHQCSFGQIKVRWNCAKDTFTLSIHVPVGCICEVALPNGETQTILSGDYTFSLPYNCVTL